MEVPRSPLLLLLFLLFFFSSPSLAGTLTFANNNAMTIPYSSNGNYVSSTITVSGVPITSIPSNTGGNLLVQMRLKITHPYPVDLILKLCDPSGTCAVIGNENGASCSAYYSDILIDDSQSFQIGDTFYGCSGGVGNKAPTDSFQSKFKTHNPNGVWTLMMTDDYSPDTGTMNFWEMHFLGGCLGTSPCLNGGTCTSTGWAATAYTCSCPTGYSPPTCTDTNECTAGTYSCPSNAACLNTVGSYTCTCAAGYSGTYPSCTDINECSGTNNCNANAACANTIGSYTCTCNSGYVGDGVTCLPVTYGDGGFTNPTPIPIPDQKSISSTITVSGISVTSIPTNTAGTLLVALKLKVTHTYPGDLIITLCDPSSGCATVASREGGSCDALYVDRWIDDSQSASLADVSSSSCSYPTYFKPTQSFQTKFGGHNPNGVWTLTVSDNAAQDTGTLVYWEIHILNPCIGGPCQHGGVCSASGWKSTQYTCNCAGTGYTGATCAADLNECTSGTYPCGSNTDCTNTVGSYTCACKNGFTGSPVSGCTDINECTLGTSNCLSTATCTNNAGSFTCSCLAGYSGDGVTSCTDVDECNGQGSGNTCATSPARSSTCTNTPGSYTCACSLGYTGNGFSCTDVNECSGQGTGNNCNAKATCANTVGSFTCTCNTGYEGDGITCTDVNECSGGTSNCHSNATCTNTQGSFTCACKTGFTGNGVTCADNDECALGTNNCGANTNCTNTPGSFTCPCKTGYSGSPCADINECSINGAICNTAISNCINTVGSYYCECKDGYSGAGCTAVDFCANATLNNCSANAHCQPLFPGFTCTCLPGYSGDGVNCANVDECSNTPFPCHSNATCADTTGSFTCACKPGFYGSGLTCSDYNECSGEGTGNNCHAKATCTNTPGSFTCSCIAGYIGNGTYCADANECQNQGSGNQCANGTATCTNTVGSYYCTCITGYSGDGITCNDVDECLGGNNCNANANCHNNAGSFTCACKSGYSGDGVTCTDYNECNNEGGGNNCTSNASCFNSPGSYSCSCNTGFAGDGRTCIQSSVASVNLTTSTSIQVTWSTVAAASLFTLQAVSDTLVTVLNVNLSSSITSYNLSGLPSSSTYTFTLTTWALSNTRFASSQPVQGTTRPAALTSVNFVTVTTEFVMISFTPSAGTADYSCIVSQSGTELVHGNLATQLQGGLRFATFSNLDSNTDYTIQIFAGTETVGYSFDVTTSPDPVGSLSGQRYDNTSVILEWTQGDGITKYSIVYGFLNGTSVGSLNFTTSSTSQVITNLASGVMYRFVVYVGNAFGIDYLNGPTVDASTLTLFCNTVNEGNATWPRAVSGQSVYGSCDVGYGGKPSRTCTDPGAGSEEGTFGTITNPCIKLPDPLETAPKVDIYSNRAVVTWSPRSDCQKFNIYVVLSGDTELPANNGQGMGLATPTFTLQALVPARNYTVKVYCGNGGGFETTGKTATFETYIPEPGSPTLGVSTSTSVSVSWTSNTYADWYRIAYAVVGGGKKAGNGLTVFKTKHVGTSVEVTGLEPGTTYDVHIYSGHGSSSSGYEPRGTVIKATTLGDSGNNTDNGGLGTGAIVGIVVGVLGLVLAVAAIMAFFVVRQSRRTNKLAAVVSMELSQRETSSDRSIAKGRQTSSLHSAADATLLNTTMEISVPGFLLLDHTKQFRVERPLGSGGAATVFKGILLDQELVSQYNTIDIALKKVEKHPKLSAEENKERFLQEVSIIWSCTFHQNVAKLVGYTLEPNFYIVTKLYDIDLYALIHHPEENISPLLALKLCGDVANAMAYMQDVGIIHRDLKSANVLLESVPLNQTQSMLRAVVCDFGLARVTNSATTLDNMKFRDIGGFSPRYAAPEVLANAVVQSPSDPEVDKKSDVYSFAIIIWELLTRRIPWNGLKREEIEMSVRSGLRPDLPADDGTDQARAVLLEMMKACWHDNPHARPSFAQITTKINSLL